MPVNTYWDLNFGTSFATLAACTTCLGLRDNSKCHTYLFFFIDFHRLFDSGLRLSALRLRLNQGPRLNSWSHTWHDSDGAGGIAVYFFLRNCLSTELRVSCCQYSRAFLFWALLILTFSRAARSSEVAPRWYCAQGPITTGWTKFSTKLY